jgi:photosystem II stability/assembly factor-like uncharacterized protein
VKILFSAFLHLNPTSTLARGLVLPLLFLSLFPGTAFSLSSQLLPLAEKSLLLDGQVIGERIIVVGERGHILISEDQGLSWQQQEVPTRATLTSVFFVDPANGWAAGHDSVILQTRDGGRHWQEVYADPDDERPIFDLWFRDMNHGYAVGAYGLFLVTHNGGKDWEIVDFEPATMMVGEATNGNPWDEDEADIPVDFHFNQIAATESGRVFISAEAGNIYRSDDGCRTWISIPSPYEGSFYGTLPLDQNRLLAFGLRGHLFRSENAGSEWTEVYSDTQATLNDGVRLRDGRIVLAGLAGAVLISEDYGHSFKLYSQTDRAGISKVLPTDDGALILVGEHGVERLRLPEPGKGASP